MLDGYPITWKAVERGFYPNRFLVSIAVFVVQTLVLTWTYVLPVTTVVLLRVVPKYWDLISGAMISISSSNIPQSALGQRRHSHP
jgi:hypothetical protein